MRSGNTRRKRPARDRNATRAGRSSKRNRWPKRVRDTGIAVVDLLALAHAVYTYDGWRSAKRAARPSWEIVYQIHQDVDAFKSFQAAHPGFRISAEDEDAAALIIAWSQDPVVDDLPIEDYRHALRCALAREDVSGKSFSLVCSAVDAYKRDVAPTSPSLNYVGSIGARDTFHLELRSVTSVSPKRKKFGIAHRLGFTDVAGNAFVWFSSRSPSELGLVVGRRFAITATVRAHEHFRGSKQTKITRGRVLEQLTATPAAAA